MKKTILFLLLMAFSLTSFGHAEERLNMVKHCGVGAMVSPDDGTVAALVNIFFSPGSSTTSYISSKDMCAGNRGVAARFIYKTYAVIEEETAIGSGEHLTSALNIMGCEQSLHADLTESLRTGYMDAASSNDFSSKNKLEKTEAYFNVFDETVTPVCATI